MQAAEEEKENSMSKSSEGASGFTISFNFTNYCGCTALIAV